MNSIIFIALFTVLIVLGTHLYSINSNQLINKLNSFVLFLSAGFVIVEWNIHQATLHSEVTFLDGLHTSFITLITLIMSICALYFSRPFEHYKQERWIVNIIIASMAFSAIILIYSTAIIHETTEILPEKISGNWVYTLKDNFFSTFYLSWFILLVLLMNYCFFVAFRKAKNSKQKKWHLGLLLAFAVMPPFLIIYFLFLPSLEQPSTYDVSPFLFALVCILSWVFSNFKLFELSPDDALARVLASVPNIVVVTDTSFKVKIRNEVAATILLRHVKNQNSDFFEALRKTQGMSLERYMAELNILGINKKHKTKFTLLVNGKYRTFSMIATKVVNKRIHTGYSFVAMDITSFIEKEEQLQHYNDELEKTNKELERFVFNASHDLKTPLRNVKGFITLLKRKLKDNLDPEVNEYINIAQSNAQNMYTLINEILEYAMVKSKQTELKTVDLNETLRLVKKNLSQFLSEKNAIISCKSRLPIIESNNHQMIQLFQNLIENGLKYNIADQPTVEISSSKDNEYLVLSINDNGIGIDSQYHEMIFKPFNKLHHQAKYKGSGIGLAICNDIVELHNGHIKLISEEQLGSTFFIYLKVKVISC